jgi:hypothetical protein
MAASDWHSNDLLSPRRHGGSAKAQPKSAPEKARSEKKTFQIKFVIYRKNEMEKKMNCGKNFY